MRLRTLIKVHSHAGFSHFLLTIHTPYIFLNICLFRLFRIVTNRRMTTSLLFRQRNQITICCLSQYLINKYGSLFSQVYNLRLG